MKLLWVTYFILNINAAIDAKLNDILAAQRGNERRKWGIENSGLCLLVAWANEIMQREAGQQVA